VAVIELGACAVHAQTHDGVFGVDHDEILVDVLSG
jgi:hypothetical protein